jgi:hypothetical protein
MRTFKLDTPPNYRKVIRYELIADTPQDVYEKNYSTVKSAYGLDSLSDGTYVGESVLDTDGSPATTIYTDTGEVLVTDGRYRDTRASVTLVSIDTYGAVISTSPASDSVEWLEVIADDELSRYVKSDINATITLEIGPSLKTAKYTETDLLIDVFPAWMEIRTDEDSHGQRLLNVVAEEIEELKKHSMAYPQRGFISYIPEGIKAYVYLCELPSEECPIDVIGSTDESPYEYFTLSPAEDLTEFLEAESTKHLYFQDGRLLFTCGEYDILEIDGEEFPQEEVHVFNWFDNIGVSLDTERLPEETNAEYKLRLLDVFVNPPGASNERITAAIERDSGCTGLDVYELSNSEVPWAATNDPASSGKFYIEATEEHKDLAKWCNEQGAIGFDYFRWGHALFDLYPESWNLAELPYLLDYGLDETSPATVREPGIGFGADLIAKPYERAGTYNYSIAVKARGFLQGTETIYPPVTVNGRVVPSATLTQYENEFTGRHIVLECVTDGSPSATYRTNLTVEIPRDPLVATNTNEWVFPMPQFGSSQPLNMAEMTDTDATEIEVVASTIASYKLYQGYWDFANQTLLPETGEAFDPTLSLGYDGAYTSDEWDVTESPYLHPLWINVKIASAAPSTVTAWTGNGTPFTITCNESQAIANATIPVPRNTESILGLGAITYTIVVDSVLPDTVDMDGTPADAICVFSTGGTTHVGWIDEGATINLSSDFQIAVDKFTPSTDDTELIYAGTLTLDEPTWTHTILRSDFGLAGGFVGAKYEVKVTGDVLVRLATDIGVTSDVMTVELNPVYMFEWEPSVAPGTIYLSGNEYYLHSDPETESVTGTSYVLAYPVPAGIPLSFSEELLETHFTDDDGVPTLTITQEVEGNGTRYLPIWYDNAVSITVEGVSKSLLIDNIVDNVTVTTEGTLYTVAYQVTDSYCVDYAWYVNGEYRPKITLQEAHRGLTVTYTPYNPNGYWINTDIATNPIFTHKNRDFLYIDDETVTPETVEILTLPPILYRDVENPIFGIVKDADGNGVPGVAVSVATNDSQHENATSDVDGYVSVTILGPGLDDSPLMTDLDVTIATDESPSITATLTYQLVTDYPTNPAKLYLEEQSFQVAAANQSIPQTIDLLLLDEDGEPVQVTGSYTVWCSNSSGNVGSTPISSSASGIATLTYTPTYVGRYVATFTLGGETQYVGWELVERT